MNLMVVLDKDGVNRIAENGKPYSFDFRVREVENLDEAVDASNLEESGEIKILEFIASIPSKEEVLALALRNIDKKMKEVRLEAAREVRELEVRKANMLALPAPEAKFTEVDDGIPF